MKENKNFIFACIGVIAALVLLCAVLFYTVIDQKKKIEVSNNIMDVCQSNSALDKQELRRRAEQISKLDERLYESNAKLAHMEMMISELNKRNAGLVDDASQKDLRLSESRTEIAELKRLIREGDVSSEQVDKYIAQVADLKTRLAIEEEAHCKDNAFYFYNEGVFFLRLGQVDEAIDSFKKSIEYGPDNNDAYHNLGYIYKNYKKDRERALMYYSRSDTPEPAGDALIMEMIDL